MGLDTTHDAFHGAYSAFNRFRQFVAEAIGGSYPPHEDKSLDGNRWYFDDAFRVEDYSGLYEFFTHSDCDGEISPEMCATVANDLESILPSIEKLAENKEAFGHILHSGGFVQVTKNFIDGCRLANSLNEPLEFR